MYNIKSFLQKKTISIITLSFSSLYASYKVCRGFRAGCWQSKQLCNHDLFLAIF